MGRRKEGRGGDGRRVDGEKEWRAEVVTEGGGEGMLGWVQYTGGGGEERERYRGGSLSRFHA